MAEKKLFLLDAYALIYRAYYAFIKNPRINSKGLNTSAVLGFTNTLDEIIRKEQPTHIAIGFDRKEATFRHKMFPEYKAQRPPMPDDLRNAIPYIKQVIEGYNIPIVEKEGFEADDVIGTLAKKAEKEGFQVFMMTPDKDYCQLVSENIFLYKPKSRGKGVDIWGLPEVQENFNVQRAEQVIDVLSLWGDAADNIPGAEGVGEKGSKDLIGKYGSVQGLYDNIEEIRGKKKEKIMNSRAKVDMAMELIRIALDVDVEFDAELFRYKGFSKEVLEPLFADLEFRALSARILGVIPAENAQQGTLFDMPQQATADTTEVANFKTIADVEHKYYYVDTPELRAQLIEQLATCDTFCFDTETTGTNVHEAELVGLAFAWKAHEAYYVPVPENQDEAQLVVNEFRAVMEQASIQKVGQNIKFDILMLKAYGVQVAGTLFDTMIAHYLLEPDKRHNMTLLAETLLQYSPVKIEELIGEKGKKQGNMRDVPAEKIREYAAEDADITWQLMLVLRKKLEEAKLTTLFEEIEMPLVYVLADMEKAGVRLHSEALHEYAIGLREDIIRLEKEVIELAGVEFNVASPKQLGEVLFDTLKLDPKAKRTGKSGQYSTNEKILQKLASKHDIVPKILEFRQLKKLLSTYVEALPLLVNAKTGKIHTTYSQAVAATGRLSSNDPNLQNIPIRTTKGKELRKAFIPSSEEHVLLAADYSQIELRIIAHLSQDKNMVEAFQKDEDIHAATAAKIHDIPLSEVSREMRSNAKGANFGIVYGISSFGLAENLGISRREAKALIDGYFATYPEVKNYMDKNVAFARENEYVSTIKDRKRLLRDINSKNGMERGMAERNAINAPIQGSAADIIKIAMINVQRALQTAKLESKMILQVHDELVFDVLKTELEQVKELVAREMEAAVQLIVPLRTDMGVGENWLQAH